jgi:hypothetical protein
MLYQLFSYVPYGNEAFTIKKAVGRKLKLNEIYLLLPTINVAKRKQKRK